MNHETTTPSPPPEKHDEPGSILVTGTTGYIGGRLVPHLLDEGEDVTCLIRPGTTLERPFADDVNIAVGSADDADVVARAAEGCRIAYYLIHSLDVEDFEERDRQMADAFRRGCERAGVERIVYLGGLGDDDDDLSPHLRSRHETGRTLAAGPIPVTELRAAIIIGSGSASFEMLRSLTEVLPVMVTPSWVDRTRCQPVSINDVLCALLRARHRTAEGHDVLELGGPDVVTYREMIQTYARVAGLTERRIIGVPVLSPKLSSHWVSVVTPLPARLSKQLVHSLINDVVVLKNPAAEALDLDPLSFEDAVREAVSMVRDLVIPTRWTDGSYLDADAMPGTADPAWAGGLVLQDRRVLTTSKASPDDVFRVVTSLGGDRGWMWGNWMWALRGLLDQAMGGSGLRRGRRHPDELVVGDAVDFWRVTRLTPGEHLRLRAEMLLPGHAWLEWNISDEDQGGGNRRTTVEQRARFVPKGLFGRLYWWVLVPFHQILFPRMCRRIVDAAEDEATHRERLPISA